jgi:predicted chitinase
MRANEFLSEDDGPVKLKLNNNNAAKAFIERVYAKYPHTMQNNHVMVWGSGDDQQFAMFELTPSFSKRGAVEVKWFQAYPLRQGVGSRAMKELQALAREDGISLTLYPWDKGQVSQSKLTKFYKGQGFSPTVKGGKAMKWDPSIDEAELDPTGWGATPQGTDIDYFGLKVKMRPSTFLKLSHPLNSSEQNSDVEKHMQGGGKIAYPFLEVKDPVEWEDGDFSQVGKVVNHEGRNRMTHWIKMKGDEPIQVNVFLRGANRRRYVTDDMIQALSQGLISQTGQLVKNPFDASTALEEAGEQGNRWTGAEEYRHLVELDLEEGWKEKAAAGALALGALGAQGDAEAKYKETWIQPKQQAAQSTMAPAAKFDSTKVQAKAPIAKTPATNTPTVGATNVDPTAMNILSLHNPEAEEVLHRTAKAAGLKGTELAQFMAQTRHESADFSRMKEIGGEKYFNKLYDPKTSPRTAKILGNTKIGDGIRYHGRGFIQITGRDNYRMAGDALRLPLEQHPELASKPAIAAKIAVWYWKTRVKPYVQNFADTAAVTKKINPAMRGLQDRHEYFKDYKNII